LNEIVEHYKKIHKSGLSLRYLDLKESNFQDFKNELQTVSMFLEKKLLILKNAFSNQEFKEKFLKEGKVSRDSKEIILFYEKEEIPGKDSFAKFLKKNGKTQEFNLLEGERLKHWVKKEFEKYGCQIEDNALEKLIEFAGNDLWQLSNEIKKLVNYKQNKKIEAKDIEILVKPKIETDIFKTIDSIAAKNKRQALILLHRHLEKGDSPIYLLSMINFQFRNLLIIRDLIEKNQPYYSILKKSKLNPFVVKKSYQQANRFTLQELKKIYHKIFEVDRDIKTGRLSPETALDLLITEI
jgi:DNA polymerase-3 subunit delta